MSTLVKISPHPAISACTGHPGENVNSSIFNCGGDNGSDRKRDFVASRVQNYTSFIVVIIVSRCGRNIFFRMRYNMKRMKRVSVGGACNVKLVPVLVWLIVIVVPSLSWSMLESPVRNNSPNWDWTSTWSYARERISFCDFNRVLVETYLAYG